MQAAGAIYGTLPKSLTDIVGKDALGGTLNYLERNLEVMRGFSTFGADFAGEVEQMIVSATASRIGLDGLSKIIGQSADTLLLSGVTVQDGLDTFITRQTKFYKNFTEDEKALKRLGYTVDEITDTFLNYDKISNYARVRTERTDEERNRAAVEFSIELDKLSRLTGKQREVLANQMAEVARAGDVQARTNQLTSEAGRQSLNNTITLAKEMSPALGKLTQDLLTAGIPKGESRRLMGLAGEYSSAVLELRKAQERGNKEEIAAAEDRVKEEATRLRQNSTIQQLALFSGINEYTNIAAQTLYDTAEGPVKAFEVAAGRIATQGGTLADAIGNVRKQIETEQGRMIADATEGSRRIQQAVIQALTEAQQTATTAQITGTQELFKALSSPIAGFSKFLTDLNLPGKVNELNSYFNTMITNIRALSGDIAAEGNLKANIALQKGNNALAREVFELSRRYNEATGPEREEIGAKLAEALKKVDEAASVREVAINANNVTVVPNQSFIDRLNEDARRRGENVPPPRTGPIDTRETGSLGMTGKLFENFGKQSTMLLHGIESVQTPEQTAEIMRNSAIGTAQAFADSLRGMQGMEMATYIKGSIVPAIEQMSGTTLQSLNGMLNTLKSTTVPQNNANQTQQFDMAMMEQLLTKLASNVKGPVEEALKELKGPMEQFASTAREQLDVQQRQLRGIKGIGGDAMRGLA